MRSKDILEKAKSEIPSVDEILEQAWNELNFDKDFVERNFGSALIRFEGKANEIYMIYERKSLEKLAKYWIEFQELGKL
ncbi:hypothetical protein HRbin19_00836 [bacterium HR19]|nr:hypothetical protein HRbin19_00836 [bacterium HR19]